MKISPKIIAVIILFILLITTIYLKRLGLFFTADQLFPIPSILLLFYYVFILKGKNTLILIFMLFDALSLSLNFIEGYDELILNIASSFSIISFISIFIYIVKKINLKTLAKTHFIYPVVLIALGIYIVYSLPNSVVPFNNEDDPFTVGFIMGVLYNILIALILAVALINFIHNDSKKEFLLFLFCAGLTFGEIIYWLLAFTNAPKNRPVFEVLDAAVYFSTYAFLIYYLHALNTETNKPYIEDNK